MNDNRAWYPIKVEEVVSRAQAQIGEDAMRLVRSLTGNGEEAEGLLALAWVIVQERTLVPRELVQDIRELSDGFIDPADFPLNLDEFIEQE